ncbi:MAG: amidohydrolase family protein, partial [Bifidobacteriaceae bacterium]|nr:amidohydrolase family protein [Bifidobacteriaceae bacterium]
LDLTVETCPHYLTCAAGEVPDGSTVFKCCPPLRGQDNRERLWQGLADGVIDLVASDHSPSTPDLKHIDSGDFGRAWGGIASVQLILPAVWTGWHERGGSLEDVVRWLAQAPARRLGLGDKGRIAPGGAADFVFFAPADEVAVDPADLRHRHRLTPYAGRVLRGRVRQTWLAGRPIDFTTPRGTALPRPSGDNQTTKGDDSK